MKTSLIIIAALFLNTTFLFSGPISSVIHGISPWVFGIIEGLLLGGYFLNKWIVGLTQDFMLDLGYLDVFVINDPNKKS